MAPCCCGVLEVPARLKIGKKCSSDESDSNNTNYIILITVFLIIQQRDVEKMLPFLAVKCVLVIVIACSFVWAICEKKVVAANVFATAFILTIYFLACEVQHCCQIDKENVEKGFAAKMTVAVVNDLI